MADVRAWSTLWNPSIHLPETPALSASEKLISAPSPSSSSVFFSKARCRSVTLLVSFLIFLEGFCFLEY